VHQPDAAAVEGQDVRFLDVHDAVIQGSYLVPAIRRLDAHAALLRSRQEDVPDGTIRAPAVQEGAAAPSRASSGQTIESRRFPVPRPDHSPSLAVAPGDGGIAPDPGWTQSLRRTYRQPGWASKDHPPFSDGLAGPCNDESPELDESEMG